MVLLYAPYLQLDDILKFVHHGYSVIAVFKKPSDQQYNLDWRLYSLIPKMQETNPLDLRNQDMAFYRSKKRKLTDPNMKEICR